MARPRHGPRTSAAAAPVRRPGAGYVVAHELRTPLTSLILASRVLLSDTLDGAQRREVLCDIAAEAQRLADAVEDLLVLAGLEPAGRSAEPGSILATVRAELDRALLASPRLRVRALLPADVALPTIDAGLLRHLVHDVVAACTEAAGGRGTLEATLGSLPAGGTRLRFAGHPRRTKGSPPAPLPAPLRDAAARVLAQRIGATLAVARRGARLEVDLAVPGGSAHLRARRRPAAMRV